MKSRTQRRAEAEVRQRQYNQLSLEAKIQQCRTRRGESRRELKRLLARTQK